MNDAPVAFHEQPTRNGMRIGIAELNRPARLNALDLDMCLLMLERFRAWRADPAIACVLLHGRGEKGFCAGGDVARVVREARRATADRYDYGDAFFTAEYKLDLLIHEFGKPVVSWAHGVTMGGGVGLAVGASHRIVSERVRMAMPEIHIGLFPDVGGGWFLNRAPGSSGLLMALTGLTLNDADALFAGLADWTLAEDRHASIVDVLSDVAWTPDPQRNSWLLNELFTAMANEDAASRPAPASALQARFDEIRPLGRLPDAVAFRDALQALAEQDAWWETPARNLAQGSPTAAAVTFEYLRRCRLWSLRQVLELDLMLAKACLRQHDFAEGVRALLIDKDRQPKWQPARFEDIDSTLVNGHFQGE